MMTKYHYHFLISASLWPILCAMTAFNLFFSFLLFSKFGLIIQFLLNLFSATLTWFMWWLNYSNELNLMGQNSFNLTSGLKLAMLLFISSEVFFFFSFFWSYFQFLLSPSLELGSTWPPITLEMFSCLNAPLVNTLVLLTSGVSMTLSHHCIIEGGAKFCAFYAISTFTLGLIFSYLQWMEYNSSFFSISDSSFGASFFMLTGFHGTHVIIGSLFIFISMLRLMISVCSKNECCSFEMAAWYWHFVDVVWIFLYYFIYFLNN